MTSPAAEGPGDAVPIEVPVEPETLRPLREVLDNHVRQVLAHVGGNKAQAARILGIDRRTLYRRLERER